MLYTHQSSRANVASCAFMQAIAISKRAGIGHTTFQMEAWQCVSSVAEAENRELSAYSGTNPRTSAVSGEVMGEIVTDNCGGNLLR